MPDYSPGDLDAAIAEFHRRNRRFGVLEHMKTRVLSAVALLLLLLVIVLVLPAWATAALFGAAAAVAAYELLYRTGMVKNLRLVVYAMVMAVLVSFWEPAPGPQIWRIWGAGLPGAAVWRCCWPMAAFGLRKVCLCLAAGLLLPCSHGPGPDSGYVCRRGPWAK